MCLEEKNEIVQKRSVTEGELLSPIHSLATSNENTTSLVKLYLHGQFRAQGLFQSSTSSVTPL